MLYVQSNQIFFRSAFAFALFCSFSSITLTRRALPLYAVMFTVV